MAHALEIVALLRDLAIIIGVVIAIKLYQRMLEVKEAEIGLLKTRVSHLEKLSAPALLEQLEKMSPALDRYAARAAELEQQMSQMSAGAAAASTVGIATGALEALSAFNEFLAREGAAAGFSGQKMWPELERFKEVTTEIGSLIETALAGKRPAFPHLQRVLENRGKKRLSQKVAESKTLSEPSE